jgi:trans-2,3-dihydro-3-hydroxyanthranilate isomerase
MEYQFEQVDVFTKRRFAGNPLAVFTDAAELTHEHMQLIAREMNLSETTFVVPSTRPDCVARYHIFTPGRELPFAGHPTLGTAFVIARTRRAITSSAFCLEAKVGAVPVRFEACASDQNSIFFTSPAVNFGNLHENRAQVAETLNLREADLLPGAPIQLTGCPELHVNVGLLTPELVDSAIMNGALFSRLFANEQVDGVYIFAPAHEPNRFYARLLSFENGSVVEDPATGSAASPLGAYLVRYGLVGAQDTTEIVIEQGTKMGRQSFINVRVSRHGQAIDRIDVGGSVVPVLTGTLTI